MVKPVAWAVAIVLVLVPVLVLAWANLRSRGFNFHATVPAFFLCNRVEAVRVDVTSLDNQQLLTRRVRQHVSNK